MDEREFLATLYQEWSKTTGAENQYWMPVELPNNPGRFKILAVDQDDRKTAVATLLTEADAAWITALHGSFGDVYRRVLEAFDEADGLDLELDKQIGTVAELSIHIDELRERNAQLERDLERCDLDLMGAQSEAEYWKEQAQSE